MKKVLSVLLVIVLMFSLAACANSGSATGGEGKTQSTIDKVLKNKKLIIGTAPGYLPFEMKDVKGNFVGYDIDIGNAIGKAMGVPVEYKQYEFSGLIPALQTGDIDMIIAGMTIRGDRALAVSFSNPYYAAGEVLMVSANDTTTNSWEDLDKEGKKIATSLGTTGALLSKQLFKHAEVVDYADFPTACIAIAQGKADGIIYDKPGIEMYEIMNEGKVRGIYDIISAENAGIVIRHNDLETVIWLNAFLEGYKGSPDDLESIEKWFHTTDWMDSLSE